MIISFFYAFARATESDPPRGNRVVLSLVSDKGVVLMPSLLYRFSTLAEALNQIQNSDPSPPSLRALRSLFALRCFSRAFFPSRFRVRPVVPLCNSLQWIPRRKVTCVFILNHKEISTHLKDIC